jgi:hypothetical protein
MAPALYDPLSMAIMMGGQLLSGFMDSSFLSAERNEDSATLNMGADGEGAIARNRNRSGQIKITLQQTSPANAILSAYHRLFEISGTPGIVPFAARDLLGADVVLAPNAWIKKPPAVVYSKEIEGREWTIETDNLDLTLVGVP